MEAQQARARMDRAFLIALRVSELRSKRASRLGEAAGLGHHRNVWGNAMISAAAGKPWASVDYSALRAALRVDAMPSPFDLAYALANRLTGRI